MQKIYLFLRKLGPVEKGLIFFFIALFVTVPFLGLTEFNTKGEPREAVVSLSMLKYGDWTLPENNGGDIPYKPMMFHWAGAIVQIFTGGPSEFGARFPSAIALSLLVGGTVYFYARYSRKKATPALAGAILLTCFEMHRAGMAARVDMMLTCWMVLAFYLLYRWWVKEHDPFTRPLLLRVPWLAILCMSAAVLSKGPVGVILPLLAMGIFMTIKKVNFFEWTSYLIIFMLLSLILPALWYYAAWKQGGQPFLDLVMEENFGRMSGTMSYESHSNPWHYNFWITAAGFLPWTLLALFGGIAMLFKWLPEKKNKIRFRWTGTDLDLFSLISLATILIFYCLPASKRSVYLMPAYPFIAWFVARWFIWLGKKGFAGSIRLYGAILAILIILVEAVFLYINIIPEQDIVFTGKNADFLKAAVLSLREAGVGSWILVSLMFASGIAWFVWRGKLKRPTLMLGMECVMLACIFISMDGVFQPRILNVKSIKDEAKALRYLPGGMYEFIEFGETNTANKYHFFELDYYLNDRISNFRKEHPYHDGNLAIPATDTLKWLPEFRKEGYYFKLKTVISKPGRKEEISIYQFSRQPFDRPKEEAWKKRRYNYRHMPQRLFEIKR